MQKWLYCLVVAGSIACQPEMAAAQGGIAMAGANDLRELARLNDDYIESVQRSDVTRFNEILADDFLCSMPDATLLDAKRSSNTPPRR